MNREVLRMYGIKRSSNWIMGILSEASYTIVCILVGLLLSYVAYVVSR